MASQASPSYVRASGIPPSLASYTVPDGYVLLEKNPVRVAQSTPNSPGGGGLSRAVVISGGLLGQPGQSVGLATDVGASASSGPLPSYLLPPTAEQLLALRFLPGRSRAGAPDKASRGKKGKSKVTGKVFNVEGPRPLPTLTSPLTEYVSTLESTAVGFVTSITVPAYLAQSVALNQFGAYASYTSLFDEYKIDHVEIWTDPAVVGSSTVGSTMFASVVDLDDANTPANFADVADRQGAVISVTTAGHYHKWKPYVAYALYSGAFTSYGSEPAPWIDCASPAVQHYGIKFATSGADGSAKAINVTVRAQIRFRGAAI